MIITDVHYGPDGRACAAAIWFERWDDATPTTTRTAIIEGVAEYQPGQFYKRELPCLEPLLRDIEPGEVIIVDGHAWLAEDHEPAQESREQPQLLASKVVRAAPGLGAWLYEAHGGRHPVIGVAKNYYHQGVALPLLRGASRKPLWISACGMDPEAAVAAIAQMHGPHRLPTLLKQVDRLARDGL